MWGGGGLTGGYKIDTTWVYSRASLQYPLTPMQSKEAPFSNLRPAIPYLEIRPGPLERQDGSPATRGGHSPRGQPRCRTMFDCHHQLTSLPSCWCKQSSTKDHPDKITSSIRSQHPNAPLHPTPTRAHVRRHPPHPQRGGKIPQFPDGRKNEYTVTCL